MTVTLALGLGANTVVFSLVRSVLFADMPLGANTGRVVSLHSTRPTRAQQLEDAALSPAELVAVRAGGGLAAVEAPRASSPHP